MKKEQRLKKCIFPLIMTIITFVIGCFFFYLSKGDIFNIRIKILFLGYLPFIVFIILLLTCYFKCGSKKSKVIIKIISIILTIILLCYYMFAIFMSAILEAINPITDTKYYKDKVNGHLLEVFPKDIPTNAEEVNFFYSPDFLQGGTSIALYYIDKDMTIDKFDEKYKFKAEWVGYFEDYNDKDGLLTGAFLNTPAQYNNENDYIIYLVNSRCDNSGYCNHGNFLFTSFNKNTNEIIFKSENW